MIELRDIAGLSKPLTRLFEVIAEGIGALSRPILTKMNANTKAYEIRAITTAIAESQKLLGTVRYDKGEIVIESSQNVPVLELPELTIDKRVESRIAYQEMKKQFNLERIIQFAVDDIDGTEEVSSDCPDSDWTTRFFRIAEDISTEQMQVLWGKVLAGEVKRPGSFSLRTLDILKNISQKEAEIFVRIARIAFYCDDILFIPNPDNGTFLNDHFGISFLDLLLLREIGLIVPNDLGFIMNPSEQDAQSIFICGTTCVFVFRPAGTAKQSVMSAVFTEIGRQLFQLVESEPADPQYIEKFASFFQIDGVIVKSGKIESKQGNRLNYTDFHEVPGNKLKT